MDIRCLAALLLLSTGAFAWLDPAWQYRAPITVNNSGSGLTDYQVAVNTTNLVYNNTGLVGSWHFSENYGTSFADMSGNGNTGTYNGETFSTGTLTNFNFNAGSGWVSGKYGTALKFDGIDDYVDLAGTSGVSYSTMTLEAWVYYENNTQQERVIVGKHLSGSNTGYFLEAWYNQLGFYVSGTPTRITTTENFNGGWHHVAGVYDAGAMRLYVDGVLKASGATSGIATNAQNVNLGRINNVAFWNGTIDDVRIYSRALSASEISQTYQNNTFIRSGLAGYWRFDEGSGNVSYDTHHIATPDNANGTRFGNALSFDGVNDYVSVPDSNSLDLTSELTIEAWIYAKSFNAVEGTLIVGKHSNAVGDYYNTGYLLAQYQNKLLLQFGDGVGVWPSTGNLMSNTTLSTDTWYHVAATRSGTQVKLYLNGRLDASLTTIGSSIATNNRSIWIGRDVNTPSSTTTLFNGTIDEVRIYNRSLSAQEIQQLYNASKLRLDYADLRFSQPYSVYETPITLSGTGTSLVDYQVSVNITNLTILSHMRPDGSDLRFFGTQTSSPYSQTGLPYWIESINSTQANVWVKANVSSGGTTIYMYYGNPAAAAASSFDGTFSKNYGESGLAGLWHMDEGSGTTIADGSGNGNTGTLVNAPAWQATDGGQWDGRNDVRFGTGSSLLFNTNNYVDLGNPPSLYIGSTMTIMLWFKTSDTARAQNPLISKKQVSNPCSSPGPPKSMTLRTGTDAAQRLDYFIMDTDCGGDGFSSASVVNDGQWHHAALVKNGSSYYGYLDGALQGNKTVSYTYTNDESWTIARRGGWPNGPNFNGYIDEVRIYNRALPAAEVYRQYVRSRYASVAPSATVGSESVKSSGNEAPAPFWQESDNLVWVKAASVPAGASAIYAYYGNLNATGAGNGNDTFAFFDDFDNQAVGNVPAGWSGGQISATGYKGNGASFAGAWQNRQLPTAVNLAGKEVSFYLSATTTGSQSNYIVGQDNNQNNGIIRVGLDNAGAFIYYNGAYTYGPAFAASRAYLVKLKNWDSSTNKVDMEFWDTVTNALVWNPTGVSLWHNSNNFSYELAFTDSNSSYDYIDTVRVRKYASPEPALSLQQEELQSPALFIGISPSSKTTYPSYNETFSLWVYNNQTTPDTFTLSCAGTCSASPPSLFLTPYQNGSATVTIASANVSGTTAYAITATSQSNASNSAGVSASLTVDTTKWHDSWTDAYGNGFRYRVPITVTNSGNATLADYQINATIDTATPISLGRMRSDCGDIRFTNGTNEMPYWIESGCNTTTTKIWARVPYIPTGSSAVYAYYGNPNAAGAGNKGATFRFFDDFEGPAGSAPNSSKWSVYKDTYGIAELDGSGRLKIASTRTGGYASEGWSNVYSGYDVGDNALMEFKWEMGAQWEWYPTFAGYIQAAGMPTRGNAFPSNAYSAQLTSGAQNPNKAYNMLTVATYGGSTSNSWNYDIVDTTIAWVRIASYGTAVKAWISYDGNTWTTAGNGIATNDLPTGRVGFQGGANGDRQNDNRVDYVIVRSYASPEPSALAGSEQTRGYRVLVRRCGAKQVGANVSAYYAANSTYANSCLTNSTGICTLEISAATYNLLFVYQDNSTAWKNGTVFG